MRPIVRALVVAAVASASAAAPASALEVRVQCLSPAVVSCSGWHTHDVYVDWTVDPPAAAKPGSCNDSWITYDTPGVERACEAVQDDEHVIRLVTIRLDKTAPVVSGAAASRPPDANGWYREPVGVTFTGTDATSGIAGCTATTYAGPDSAAAAVAGTCRDRAGNEGRGSFGLRFDATPPAFAEARKAPADRVVRLGWTAIGAVAVEVQRTPGRGDDARTVLYRGPGTKLVDRRVRNGRRYEYLLTAVDQAGNAASRSIAAVPGPRLLAPAPRARVTAPPVLRWTRVRGARYYNVQLFRDGRKVLSAWPRSARLALRRSWRYHGSQRLRPGRYRWIVWPGQGPRSRRDYGREVGRRSFVLARSA